jgi:hypothetical protein
MGLTVYCSTCGKRASLMFHRGHGNYYLHQSCLCPPYITDPYYWPRQFKPLPIIEQIKERVGLAAEEACRRMREEERNR